MGDQSPLTHVQTLFEPALQAYEMKTGVALSAHPLAVQLPGLPYCRVYYNSSPKSSKAFQRFTTKRPNYKSDQKCSFYPFYSLRHLRPWRVHESGTSECIDGTFRV